jgi:hypothetical protein
LKKKQVIDREVLRVQIQELLNKTIKISGYEIESENATVNDVLECFYDYVDCQCFRDLSVNEAKEMFESGEITFKDICYNIMKVN